MHFKKTHKTPPHIAGLDERERENRSWLLSELAVSCGCIYTFENWLIVRTTTHSAQTLLDQTGNPPERERRRRRRKGWGWGDTVIFSKAIIHNDNLNVGKKNYGIVFK